MLWCLFQLLIHDLCSLGVSVPWVAADVLACLNVLPQMICSAALMISHLQNLLNSFSLQNQGFN